MCWGAERSIELALAATEKFGDRKKHITNELLHNPGVNAMLEANGIEFIEKTDDGGKRFDRVQPGRYLRRAWLGDVRYRRRRHFARIRRYTRRDAAPGGTGRYDGRHYVPMGDEGVERRGQAGV